MALSPTLLFLLFALTAAGGAFWIGWRFRSLAAGIVAALGTLLFFVSLFGALLWLMRSAPAPI